MSQFHIRNSLHSLYSDTKNYLLLSKDIENILFKTLSKNMNINLITTVPVAENNKDIIFTSDHYLFPFAGIISDRVDNDLVKISKMFNLPIYGIVSNIITEEHISILDKIDLLYFITDKKTELKHNKLKVVNRFCPLNRSAKKPSKNIVVLGYSTHVKQNESYKAVLETLDEHKIVYDIIEESPLSLQYLYLLLENYKICIDVSEHSILEPIVSTKTNTTYIHSNENLKEHIFVDNTKDLLSKLATPWDMENFNDLNANIDTELSSEYFNQIDRIITGKEVYV